MTNNIIDPQPSLIALSEKAVPGPWKHGVIDEQWAMFHKRGGCIAQMGPYGFTVDGEFIVALVNWFRSQDWNTRPQSCPEAELPEVTDDLEIAEAALQRFHDKFMERAFIDPSTGYPEYGSQEDYYTDLCAALESVKALQDVPADPRENGLWGDES